MLLLQLATSWTFVLIFCGQSNAANKNTKQLSEQQISVVGNLECAGEVVNNAKIVLKYSRNGKELKSSRYTSTTKQQQGSVLLTTKRTEPKFLFLQIIPINPKDSKCNKTIEGKVRMREFKPSRSDRKHKIFNVGDCDFAKGRCSIFERRNSDLLTLSVVGNILCGNNKAVRATVALKPKRRTEQVINSQRFDSRKRSSSLLQAQTKEPNTLFLQIIPDSSMNSNCKKTIEAKLGLREFKMNGNKGVFDVGSCDLGTGKCTKFPFPLQ
ncbi:hypothetical protein M3Y98_00504600 [Aphelenchoides besseyi]|nr:hypothetical protein M3Y98_00504600 [Aphelenchoides besseyi]KAI6207790.1 hypothetical protein M3Y96_00046200 [Aphelenchoides besseyi]